MLRTAASDDDEPDPGAAEKPFSSSSLSAAGQDPRSTEAEPKAKSAKKRAKKPAIEIADVDMPFGYRKVEPLDYGLTAEEVIVLYCVHILLNFESRVHTEYVFYFL